MFLKFWIIWAILGLVIATWLFKWSVTTGQFDDARRAALLPLNDVPLRAPSKRGGRLHLVVLVGLAAIGVLITCAMVVMALVK